MENHGHIMAEVGGSNPPISTFFYLMRYHELTDGRDYTPL
jgi:hypothetical protein